MADSFVSDLNTALNMFKSSVNDFAIQRAVGQANDTVQQVKAADMSEQQKRAQLQQISNQLVTQMAVHGAPATTIDAVKGAIGPTHYANANAMNADAVLLGNQGLAAEAKQQQAFEEDPLNKRLAMMAKRQLGAAQSEKAAEFNVKQVNDLGKDLDASAASSRSAMGQSATAKLQADRVTAVMGDPSEWGNLTDSHYALMAEALGKLAKGGVATKEEMAALTPKGSGPMSARIKSMFTNSPEPQNTQKWAEMFNQIIQRESDTNSSEIQKDILQRATNKMHLASDRDLPDGSKMSEAYKRTVASSLTNAGIPTSPDDLILDKKSGVTTKSFQQAGQAEMLIKKAYAAQNSKDATDADKKYAAMVFSKFNIDPSAMPASVALKTIPTAIKAGRIKLK